MLTVAAAMLVTAIAAVPARAQIEEITEDRGVIQNRKYRLGHEFTLAGGALPLDPFFKGATVGGRYTFHVNDFHAVELSGHYSFNFDTYITEQLLQNFGVQRDSLPGLTALFDLNYVVKPFYGKFALANRKLLYQEVYFVAGAAGSYWTDASLGFGPDIGGGVRFFMGETVSLRADLRHAVLFRGIPILDEDFSVDNVLQLHAGLSFQFGG
jgi:outer membrane beta-barrel protein